MNGELPKNAISPGEDEFPRKARRPVRRWAYRSKWMAFSLLPALVLVLTLEIGLRVLEWDRPHLKTPQLAAEMAGIHQPDGDLFFSLRPGLDTGFQGVNVRTNRLGLRSPEVPPKRAGEFRILSLGESTTFGAGVENNATYSAILESLLNADGPTRRYRVINAGVSAYTSFQSLKYLELRGLELEPDLVLFYHEMNDSLPSAVRESGRGELTLQFTDPELYRSRKQQFFLQLVSYSAIVRSVGCWMARRKINRWQRNHSQWESNVVPQTKPPPISTPDGEKELELPPRLTSAQRTETLQNLAALCRDHGIRLLIIHPAYRDSRPHECELTHFCREHQVPMLEAFDILHPDGEPADALFHDPYHPNRLGHARLAHGIRDALVNRGLLDTE